MKREIFPISLLWILVLLAGCASVISKENRNRVKPDLRFEQIRGDPEAFRGEKVLLGGTIVGSLLQKERLLVEVLEQPLGFRHQPKDTDRSGGRFLVQMEGTHDPEVYRKGRRITVFGEVIGKRVQKLGEMDYVHPLIRADEVYLWKDGGGLRPALHFRFGIYRTF